MINKFIKSNSVIVLYEVLSTEGKLLKKRQEFNLVSYEATDEDFFEIGSAIGNILISNPREILKSSVALLMEV